MDYEDIKKLIDDMGESKLDSLDIEFPDGIKISMKKNENKVVENVIEAPAPMTVPVVKENQEQSLVATNQEEDYKVIKSPMVGTFYAKPSPDAEDFVKVGDKISQGKVVCIVEAMKLMNEIESEFNGEIIEVCIHEGEMVEYGTPLFKIK